MYIRKMKQEAEKMYSNHMLRIFYLKQSVLKDFYLSSCGTPEEVVM